MGTDYSCFLNRLELRFTVFRLIGAPALFGLSHTEIFYRLQANLCMRSSAHYSVLKGQKEEIEGQFDNDLGQLRWVNDARRIGFFDDTVGDVNAANRGAGVFMAAR